MDAKKRGFIENLIDEALKAEITGEVEWVKDIMPLKSFEDFALGYVSGLVWSLMDDVIRMGRKEPTEEDEKEINLILKRRILEFRNKIKVELGR